MIVRTRNSVYELDPEAKRIRRVGDAGAKPRQPRGWPVSDGDWLTFEAMASSRSNRPEPVVGESLWLSMTEDAPVPWVQLSGVASVQSELAAGVSA